MTETRNALPQTSLLNALITSPMRSGRLEWIGLRPARREPVIPVKAAELIAAQGIDGDRYRTTRNGARQVTLIAREDLAAIAAFLGRSHVDAQDLRRNLVTSGINLMALKNRRFCIGPVLLEGSGECAPCSRMEETFGPGGYNAVRGHGGITARIIAGGRIALGDTVLVEG